MNQRSRLRFFVRAMQGFVFIGSISLAAYLSWQPARYEDELPSSPTPELDQLMYDPPEHLTSEEIADRIVNHFPRMRRLPGWNKYEAIHRDAANKIPAAVEIERRFPATDHFITHFNWPNQESNVWNTEAFFGGRYTLTMQLDVRIDYRKQTLTPVTAPRFFLVGAYECSRDGASKSRADLQWRFSSKEFETLVASGWDFEQIGITILDTPVENFRICQAMDRAPIYPITLLPAK